MEKKIIPEKEVNQGEGCFGKFPKPVRIFLAAIVMRPQNYWMSSDMRRDSLEVLGFKLDEQGNLLDYKENTYVDVKSGIEEGKKMLDE